MNIKTVTVIGVTGTMGANVAGIFASFGDAKVYCVGRDIEKVKKTIPRIVKSVKADAIAKNLVPADFSMLEKCVAESDLVFESSKEDIGVKKEIAGQVGKALQPHADVGNHRACHDALVPSALVVRLLPDGDADAARMQEKSIFGRKNAGSKGRSAER